MKIYAQQIHSIDCHLILRLSFNGIVEELDAYKEEIEEFESKASGQEEGLVLPADLKEQIQDFMPVFST